MTPSIAEIRHWVVLAHGTQKYDGRPYVDNHLDRVVELLKPYGWIGQAVGYCHDIIEDTDKTKQDVANLIGSWGASCVMVCTDEPGANRKERKLATNTKLKLVPPGLYLGLIAKAADRLANRRYSRLSGNSDKIKMYQAEHEAFRDAAYRPGICDEFWDEMDHYVC